MYFVHSYFECLMIGNLIFFCCFCQVLHRPVISCLIFNEQDATIRAKGDCRETKLLDAVRP